MTAFPCPPPTGSGAQPAAATPEPRPRTRLRSLSATTISSESTLDDEMLVDIESATNFPEIEPPSDVEEHQPEPTSQDAARVLAFLRDAYGDNIPQHILDEFFERLQGLEEESETEVEPEPEERPRSQRRGPRAERYRETPQNQFWFNRQPLPNRASFVHTSGPWGTVNMVNMNSNNITGVRIDGHSAPYSSPRTYPPHSGGHCPPMPPIPPMPPLPPLPPLPFFAPPFIPGLNAGLAAAEAARNSVQASIQAGGGRAGSFVCVDSFNNHSNYVYNCGPTPGGTSREARGGERGVSRTRYRR